MKNETKRLIKNFRERVRRAMQSTTSKDGGFHMPSFYAHEVIRTKKDLIRAEKKFNIWMKQKKFNQKRENFVKSAQAYNNALPAGKHVYAFKAVPRNGMELELYKKILGVLKRALKKKSVKYLKRAEGVVRLKLLESGIVKPQDVFNTKKVRFKRLGAITREIGQLTKMEVKNKFFTTDNPDAVKRRFFNESQAHGLDVQYYYNFLSAAESAGLEEVVAFIREGGVYFSYYLYLKGFSIPDFYELYKRGATTGEMYTAVRNALRDIKTNYISDIYISEFEEKIDNGLALFQSMANNG